jgi:hypothetical protein
MVPVFGHEALADAVHANPWSLKMQGALRALASTRFGAAMEADDFAHQSEDFMRMIEACRDSLPLDLLERVAAHLHDRAPMHA